MAAEMITQGTENYTTERCAGTGDLRDLADRRRGMDTATVNASCLNDHRPRAMKLLADVVRPPSFRRRNSKREGPDLAALSRQHADAVDLAESQLRTRLFGDHPYGRRTGEPGDVRQDHRRRPEGRGGRSTCGPTRACSTSPATSTPRGPARSPRAISATGRPTVAAPDPSCAGAAGRDPTPIVLVDQAGAIQSQIRVAQIGVTRDHPDYQLAPRPRRLFGGCFGSRLNEVIRVQKGLTYGASGGFGMAKFDGLFSPHLQQDRIDGRRGARATLEEVQNLQSQPATPEELSLSKGFLVGSFAGDRETPQATINDLWLIESHGLPSDYLQKALSGVSATEIADVSRWR